MSREVIDGWWCRRRVRRPGATFLLAGVLLAGGVPLPSLPQEETVLSSRLREEVLAQRVLVSLRVWDSWKRCYVTEPALVTPDRFEVDEKVPTGRAKRWWRKEPVAPQQVLAIDREERPLSLALVLDTSGSLQASLPSVREAAGELLAGLAPRDRATLIAFNDTVTLEAGLTGDRDVLNWALEDLEAQGQTAVHDALHLALKHLRREEDPRAIVLLTDGIDNESRRSLEEVVDQALEADIPLFCIFHRVTYREYRKLVRAAAETGGRIFESNDEKELVRVFAVIAEGLRHVFLLSYASSNRTFDGAWRELEVRALPETWEVQTSKRGYHAWTAAQAEARRRATETTGSDRASPLPLPPVARTETLSAPLPAFLCGADATDALGDLCREGMTARLAGRAPPTLEITGWVDLGHVRELLVHPCHYGDHRPVPDDAREVALVNWGPEGEPGRFEPLRLPLPDPEALPFHLSDLLEDLFRRGGTLRYLGMPEGTVAGEGVAGEEERAVPVPRQVTVPPVPGMADDPPTVPGKQDEVPVTWCVDGDIGLAAREDLARWAFLARRPYQEWVRDRFEEDTEKLVEQEIALLRRHAPPDITEEDWLLLARRFAREIRQRRRARWGPIAAGEEGATRHLFAWYRDLEADEVMGLAEAVLISRILAGPVPEFGSLQRSWLFPARESWQRLRTFLVPTAHRSLMLLRPLHDRVRQEIYLPRIVLSRIQAPFGRGLTVDLPRPGPVALALVAGLLADPEVGERLAGGRYWCPDDGVTVWVSHHRDWIAHGGAWRDEMDALIEERDAVRDRGRGGPPGERLRLTAERRLLRRQMRRLVREARRDPRGGPEQRIFVALARSDDPVHGLTLYRSGEDPVLASPFEDPGFSLTLRIDVPLPGLEEAMAGAGIDPRAPAAANALLAARINGWTGTFLSRLLEDEEVQHVLAERKVASLRLVFDPHPSLRVDALPRLVQEEEGPVLVLNLAAATAQEAREALREMIGGRHELR